MHCRFYLKTNSNGDTAQNATYIPIFGVMLRRNNIGVGLLTGLILPGVAWLIFDLLLKNRTVILNKPAIPYLVAIALNLFAIKYLFKTGRDQTGAGMILCTFAVMVLALLFQTGYIR